jgi:hypothetical protein
MFSRRIVHVLIDTRQSGAEAVKSIHARARDAEQARIDYINDTFPREDVNRAALSRALVVKAHPIEKR